MARVSARGVSVTAPPGWDVRIYRRDPAPGEQTFTVMHCANFPLPTRCGDYGNGAVDLMGPRSILVCLVELAPQHRHDALFAAPGPPAYLPLGEFRRTTLQHARIGQLGAQRFFNAADRAWSLFVVLGGEEWRSGLVAQVNDALAALEIAPAPS